MYICDLGTYMDGLPCRKGYYCPAPANKLVPVAIQLKKDPGDDNLYFYLLIIGLTAKIYYRSADAQVCKQSINNYNYIQEAINELLHR